MWIPAGGPPVMMGQWLARIVSKASFASSIDDFHDLLIDSGLDAEETGRFRRAMISAQRSREQDEIDEGDWEDISSMDADDDDSDGEQEHGDDEVLVEQEAALLPGGGEADPGL